ncbi:hypothetical protein [Sphingomonas sp.]|uniref:hypothetical protein n=1 Tax=Sphingomonas sp. TaxID=28214 RepID=UPI003CC61AF1
MAKRMLLHDTRLNGNAPHIAQNIYRVGPKDKIANIVSWVQAYAASQGGLDELIVMCHGGEAHWDMEHQMSVARTSGGWGLQLGKRGLDLRNVALVRAWRNPKPLIGKIIIYACAAADTGKGNAGTVGDGRRFMGEMALYSGATVIASSATQMFSRSMFLNRINFGEWEGPVFSFSPDSGASTPIWADKMQ